MPVLFPLNVYGIVFKSYTIIHVRTMMYLPTINYYSILSFEM